MNNEEYLNDGEYLKGMNGYLKSVKEAMKRPYGEEEEKRYWRDIMNYEQLKIEFFLYEARKKIIELGKEKRIGVYNSVEDYCSEYSTDISEISAGSGEKPYEIHFLTLEDIGDGEWEWDYQSYIVHKKTGEKYIYVNFGEYEISFLPEKELKEPIYTIMIAHDQDEYGNYCNYYPNGFLYFSEEEAEKALQKYIKE